MVYLLKIVIFHSYVSHNQMVMVYWFDLPRSSKPKLTAGDHVFFVNGTVLPCRRPRFSCQAQCAICRSNISCVVRLRVRTPQKSSVMNGCSPWISGITSGRTRIWNDMDELQHMEFFMGYLTQLMYGIN